MVYTVYTLLSRLEEKKWKNTPEKHSVKFDLEEVHTQVTFMKIKNHKRKARIQYVSAGAACKSMFQGSFLVLKCHILRKKSARA